MKKIKKIQIFIDPYGNTLNFWWDDPKKSCEAQEAEHFIFNMKIL
jgi:hypothetical protein